MKTKEVFLGQKAELVHKIKHNDLLNFLILTNDSNVLHLNSQYAKEKGFKGQVAYGMLTASFISTLIGTKLPGNGALWKSQKLQFINPVYIDDTITVKAEVIDCDTEKKEFRMTTDIYNQHGDPVIMGEALIKLLE